MKSTIKSLIFLLIIVTLNSVVAANAKETSPELKEKAVNAKCYVELVGGGETISLWLVKPSLLKKLADKIVDQKILLIASAQNRQSKKKSTIYKAKQCVLEEDEFSSSRARAIDKELPR
tara:strand:+ start:16589 stop:16945 length:357 start_codon:yes stop_codon:yes gene_type:complete